MIWGKNKDKTFKNTKGFASPKRFKSITRRIFFWMCVVALVPLLIASYQGYHCARQAVIDRAGNHLLSVLNSRKSMFLSWLEERKADIRSLSVIFDYLENDSQIYQLDNSTILDRCRILLRKVHENNPSFETIVIFDREWNRLLSISQSDHSNWELPPSGFESELKESEDIMVGESHMHEDGRIGTHIEYKVIDQKGAVAGYVLANLNLSTTITPILTNRAGLGKTGKEYLLFQAEDHFYIHSGYQNTIIEKNSDLSRILSTESPTVMEYEDYRGTKVLGVSVRIPEIQCFIVVEIDQAEAFEWVYILRKRALLTVTLTLFIVIFIALNSSKHLSHPLLKLVEVSRKIAKGQHTERLVPFGESEVQEGSEAFNKMLDELAASHQRMVRVSSLAAVGEMSSSIVHEIRNPLSSVKLNFQALHNKFKKNSDYSDLAETSLKQLSRIDKMLSDLLNYGKPIDLKPSSLIFGNFLKEVLEIVRGAMEEKKIKVEIQDGLNNKPLIADPEQIRRALTNLLTNAIQASPLEGKIIISADISPKEPDKIIISIRDNGPGIPDHIKEKLFRPFFTTRKDGTGLGLANVKKIVDFHGGNVTAENGEEKGAIFTIVLPLGGPTA